MGESEANATASQWLERARTHARNLLSSSEFTYEAGTEISAAGSAGMTEGSLAGVHCALLWRLWAALEDRWEMRPEGSAAEDRVRRQVDSDMRRAASEWLDAFHDQDSWTRYFDRWLHKEVGYRRHPR